MIHISTDAPSDSSRHDCTSAGPAFPLAQKLNSIISTINLTSSKSQKPSTALLTTRESLTGFLIDVANAIYTLDLQPQESSLKPNNTDTDVEKKGSLEEVEVEHEAPRLPPREEVDLLLLLLPLAYLNRGVIHGKLGYHDLSSSDAYRAILCVERFREWIDEVAEEYGFVEEKEEEEEAVGFYSEIGWDKVLLPELVEKIVPAADWGGISLTDILTTLDIVSLYLIITSLISSSCLKPASSYLRAALTKFPDSLTLWGSLATRILSQIDPIGLATTNSSIQPITSSIEQLFLRMDLPIRGISRREVYPWNHFEPDRYAPETLNKINTSILQCCVSTSPQDGPWCEARLVSLPRLHADGSVSDKTVQQLGMFALRDIPSTIPGVSDPNESPPHPYFIEPTTLLAFTTSGGPPGATAAIRCEMCTNPIPEDAEQSFGCSNCEENDIWPSFCSSQCQKCAMKLYHPAICGTDWSWLHREANLKKESGNGKGPKEGVYDDDAIYCLLLQRAWALSLTQGKHPLELDEVWYLYGAGKKRIDYPDLDGHRMVGEEKDEDETEDDPIPFDFHQNIIVPHMILDSLGIPILPFPPPPNLDENDDDHEGNDETDSATTQIPPLSPLLSITHFDTSTSTLTLLNKFKGVASLTRHHDTRTHPPIETSISAIHPLYSLVNHDCDPNVYWQVNSRGEMCFRALSTDLKFWRDGDESSGSGRDGESEWEGGIRMGMEIKDSYVDPGMSVEGRRRKIWGVLGGACRCERCKQEERTKVEIEE